MSEKYLSNKKFKKSGNLSLFSIVNVRSMVISLKLALLEERKKKVADDRAQRAQDRQTARNEEEAAAESAFNLYMRNVYQGGASNQTKANKDTAHDAMRDFKNINGWRVQNKRPFPKTRDEWYALAKVYAQTRAQDPGLY